MTQKEINLEKIVDIYKKMNITPDSIYYDLKNEKIIVNYYSPINGRLNSVYNIFKPVKLNTNKGLKKNDKWFKKTI